MREVLNVANWLNQSKVQFVLKGGCAHRLKDGKNFFYGQPVKIHSSTSRILLIGVFKTDLIHVKFIGTKTWVQINDII